MFFLSERTRLAVTAAAILPSALATASSVRLGARCVSVLITSSRFTNVCCFHRVQQGKETKEFQDLVKQMLSDMKIFKQLLRKSLNLIQGMEMMNQVYFQDINIQLLSLTQEFLVSYQLAQGYMQAVGGVGRSGGNGKTSNYLTEIIGPFFRRKWQ